MVVTRTLARASLGKSNFELVEENANVLRVTRSNPDDDGGATRTLCYIPRALIDAYAAEIVAARVRALLGVQS